MKISQIKSTPIVPKTEEEHHLIIKCLHDAQAECSAGDWYYCFTGPATKEEIEAVYHSTHGEVDAEDAENIPCIECGDKEQPLHTDYRCSNCHEEDIDRKKGKI